MTTTFFAGLRDSFDKTSGGRPHEELLSVAGRTISFRTTVSTRRTVDSLRHLPSGSGMSPDLTVMVWDSGGVPPPADLGPGLQRGELPGFSSGRHLVVYDMGSSTLSALDRDNSMAYVWTKDARELPAYELATPFKSVLHWWASERQMQLVHAAAVGRPSGGVLLVGRGGSGKSTTAIACLLAGMSYAGDDYCLAGSSGLPQVWSLYETGKLDDLSLSGMPAAKDHVVLRDGPNGKSVLSLRRAFPGQMVDGFPLRAIVVPTVSQGSPCSLAPMSKAKALLAIAPSTIFQLPTAGKDAFRMMVHLTSSLPCYSLTVGDPAGAPPLLDRLSAGHEG